MKKTNKLLLSLGTATAGIAPVVAVVSCGKQDTGWKGNPEDLIFDKGNLTQGDAGKHAEVGKVSEEKSLTFLNNEYAFFNYEKEQKASIKVQEAIFAWDYHKLLKTKDDIKNLGPNDQKKKDNEKAISDLKVKMNKIANGLQDGDNLYDSANFSMEYPKILLPLSTIKNKQRDIYSNEKNAFVDSYPTKAEGEAAWLEEIAKKYGGASNEDEAIKKLIFNIVSSKSNLKNQIKVNDKYTVEQMKWANRMTGARFDEEDKTKAYFDFLVVDGTNKPTDTNLKAKAEGKKIVITGTDKLDKVYFYGSESNQVKFMRLEHAEEKLHEGGFGTKAKVNPLRLYRHALLNISPNKDGRSLPWTASADLIKKLLQFTPNQADTSSTKGKHQFDRIKDLFFGTKYTANAKFNNDVDKDTSFFLNQVSNNSPTTKTKGGSLGIHPATFFADKMFDGFALGTLAIEKLMSGQDSDISAANEGIFTKLSKAMKDAYDELTTDDSGVKKTFATREELAEYLTGLGDDKLQRVFGLHVRDTFDPQSGRTGATGFKPTSDIYNSKDGAKYGRSLVYTDGTTKNSARFAIISTKKEGGIHLTRRFQIDSNQIDGIMVQELKGIADDNKITALEYDIVGLLKPFLTNEKIIKQVTKDNPDKTKDKEAYDFQEWLKTKYAKDAKTLAKIPDHIKNTHALIVRKQKIKAQAVASGINQSHSKFLVDGIDNKKIAYYPYTTSGTGSLNLTEKESLNPEEIYDEALKLSSAEYGGA